MKTGILVHGCNLQAENWRHLAWGEAPGDMGRIPQGLLAGLTLDAEVIVFGTGASRKPFLFPGSPMTGEMLLEAEYTLAFLEHRFDDLMGFKAWADVCPAANHGQWESLKNSLRRRIEIDIRSNNTTGELKEAGEIFLKHQCDRVVLVSSPTHLVRVLRDASKLYQNDRRYQSFQDNLLAMPSATCYEGFTAADVVVVEPPHRPDRPSISSHRRIARMMGLQKLDSDLLTSFMGDFDELLQLYEDRLQNPVIAPATSTWPVSFTAEVLR